MIPRYVVSLSLLSVAAALTGCTSSSVSSRLEPVASATGIRGHVHGGQQPVAGSTIQLYTVGTAGDGSPATPLLSHAVTTDANGNFNITGLYSCTHATLVYVLATAGNPGISASNPDLALMTALGPCSSLTAATFITVNELTTVAATSALAPYMLSATAVGSGTLDAADLQSAFALADEYVDPTTGLSPGSTAPSGFTPPTLTINTLGNVAAACVNSTGGTPGDGSPCGQLFSLTTPAGGAPPVNTIAALLNVAQSPALNSAALYDLASPTAPFQPQLTAAPGNFQVAIQPAAPFSTASGLQVGPGSLAFPDTALNSTSAPEVITLSNTGTSPAPLPSIALAGANPSDFTLATTCGTSLAPAAVCTVSVASDPQAYGQRSASVTVQTGTSTITIRLLVNGVVPVSGVTLTPSVTFTTASGGVQDLTLSNFGSAPLEISSIKEADLAYISTTLGTTTTSSSNLFFGIASTTCGTSLPAQSVCTISVVSSMASTDVEGEPYTYTGSLTVHDSATGGSQTASLSSSSVAVLSPGVYVDAPLQGIVAFQQQQVGTTTATSIAYGVASYYVPAANLGLSLGGRNPSDFSFSTTEISGYVPIVGSSCAGGFFSGSTLPCTIAISFHPQAPGARSAKLFLNTSGTGEYIELTGTGAGPGASFILSSASLALNASDAASPDPATRIATSTVTLTNTGTTNFAFRSNVSGAAASALSVNGSGCAAVVPQATCTFSVTFAPATVGSYPGTLTISDANSTYSQAIALIGTASYNTPFAQPDFLQFGAQAIGTTSPPQTFKIQDANGYPLGHPLTVSLVSGSQFTLPSGSGCPANNTQVCTLTVAFRPTQAGTASEFATITDTTSGLTNRLQLLGTAGSQTLALSTTAVNFPARAVATTSVPMNVTVSNTGTLPITIASVSLTGVANSNFTETNSCGATTSLPAGATCTVSLTFAPIDAGTQGAMLQVLSNASDALATATITGTAN